MSQVGWRVLAHSWSRDLRRGGGSRESGKAERDERKDLRPLKGVSEGWVEGRKNLCVNQQNNR